MKRLALATIATIAALDVANAITTTLEFEDRREADSRAAISNEIARAVADAQPADYATVSNRAMTALQSYTETDPSFTTFTNHGGKVTGNLEIEGAFKTPGLDVGIGYTHFTGVRPAFFGSGVYNLAFTSEIPTVPTKISAFTNDAGYVTSSALASYATTNYVADAIADAMLDWSTTNTSAVIAFHYGSETVAIPSAATLTADLTGWPDGAQTFVVLDPVGSYSVAANIQYVGYGTWPTNKALCVAFPFDETLYVNPILTITE